MNYVKHTVTEKHVAYELISGTLIATNYAWLFKKGRFAFKNGSEQHWVFAHRTHKPAIENLRTKLKEKYKMTGIL